MCTSPRNAAGGGPARFAARAQRYAAHVRRRNGDGLVVNEQRLLAAALRLSSEGTDRFYGYELLERLEAWEHRRPMDHATMYRCLRKLEGRGFFASTVARLSAHDERPRVYYSLTDAGRVGAPQAAIQLLASPTPALWVQALIAWPDASARGSA